jgi:glycosyltransferase involved in cell wall biosynthesis
VKVAYYSPLPPSESGIADYSALLLPELRKRIHVTVARGGRFRRTPDADLHLYHVGNDPDSHGWIVAQLRRRPGVVVLHDFVLHHLVAGLTLARGDSRGYLDALEREHGLAGRLLGYAVIDNRIPPLWETRPEAFPLAGELLRLATGLIVHSAYVEEHARATRFEGPIWRIPHPAWPVPTLEPEPLEGDPLIGCFGHVNEAKRIPQLLAAFERLEARRRGARLLLVGPASSRLRDFELPEGVVRQGYVDEARLWALMAACDVCVNLRTPTMGETSGSVIRALSLGKPLIVSDVGWFAELPADVALKVAPDEHEVDALDAALELLAEREDVRGAMGAAARELVGREHSLERVADLYVAAIEEAAGGEAVRTAVVREVAQAAAEVGLQETDELARSLDEVGLGR